MFRCIVAEIFSLGGGHALSGGLTRAVAWAAAVVVCVLLVLWTPWAVYLVMAVRLASIVEAARHGRRGPVGGKWHWKPMLVFLVVSYGFLGVMRATALEAFNIPSAGMTPTLAQGDKIIGDKLSLRWRAPSRGEVVVYRAGGRDYVGRIVAIGGDEVTVHGGDIQLGGVAVPRRTIGETEYADADESGGVHRERVRAAEETLGGNRFRVFLSIDGGGGQDLPSDEHGCTFPTDEWSKKTAGVDLEPGRDANRCRVPRGTVFIVGDNRGNSNDSRYRGAFPVSSVRARVVGIWMPFGRIGAID